MDEQLQKAREIFVDNELDPDTRAENLADIIETESRIRALSAFSEWQGTDVTQELVSTVRKALIEHRLTLSKNQELTAYQRDSFFAKAHACAWLLSILSKDSQGQLESIEAELREKIASAT